MINHHQQEYILEKFDFIKQCDHQLYQQFLLEAQYIHLKKGDYICQQGSECTHLALLLDGSVRVYKLAETGREITLYRIEAGQSCILTASCIQSCNPFPAFAICDDNIEAVLIPSVCLQKWLAESSIWRNYIFGLIAQRMSCIISLVEEVAFHRLDQRIAGLLFQCAQKNGSNCINVTHQGIALELGTSREVVSRILLDFQSQDLIRVMRGSITVLNLEQMKNISIT